jgi:hypothetical protein
MAARLNDEDAAALRKSHNNLSDISESDRRRIDHGVRAAYRRAQEIRDGHRSPLRSDDEND